MKLLIATLDPTTLEWRSLGNKVHVIKSALDKTQNATWEVDVRYFDIKPPELNSRDRITQRWFNDFAYPLFREGNHFVNLHMSMKQWTDFGLDNGLRGANQIDDDFVGQSYLRADEHTKRGRTRRNQFVQTNLHEVSHQISRDTGVPDMTHPYHDANPNIAGIFSSYNMADWHPVYVNGLRRQLTLLEEILALMGSTPLNRPLPFHWDEVSQRYGVANPTWYPITGHHIGVDFATPVGTPVVAPTLCEVTRSEWHDALGWWCEVKFSRHYLLFAHLQERAILGEKTRGQVLAFTGSTGMSKGPHCHVEYWNRPIDRSLLRPSTWRNLTSDVTSLIK